MGKSYSVNGYLNAVLRRSSPTLLVEGPTDKGAMHRILAEEPSTERVVSIDHVALIEDTSLCGLGAKERVLLLKSNVVELTDTHPRLQTTFACLVDREWDGLELDPESLETKWSLPQQGNTHFVTIGHSIENYHFDRECVLQYLKFAFSEHYTQALEERLNNMFLGVIALAGALSMVAQTDACIGRMSGLICVQHIESRANSLYLASSFVDAAHGRGVPDPEALRRRINDAVDQYWSDLASSPHAHWLLHGHVGSDVVWASVGHIAREAGMPHEAAQQVARGFVAERRRHWLHWLATGPADRRQPLEAAPKWLRSVGGT
ncbi:MAG TPA: hypothetical protein VF169_13015 [Albitalea sp.]|uniref:hypothetical protein n=1 Tax=Piscinibacter sp. TaxID=1903157 RepID=UPI002ED4EC0A